MEEFSFQALGTHWSILIDGVAFKSEDQKKLVERVSVFEKRFSRFLPDSEVNQFLSAKKGEYKISNEFTELLRTADTLRNLTSGRYDPAIGQLMEASGYNKNYTLTPDEQKIKEYEITQWSVEGEKLLLNKGTSFDFGGIGKGYCIDVVAHFLKEQNYQHFLVEAGGDMYGTKKADGSAFQIALEWPGKPGLAFGTLELQDQALAVSDSFRRRWPAPTKVEQEKQNWHHIIDPQTKTPIKKVIGCTAVARSAFDADCMTSGLFLADPIQYEKLRKEFNGEYVVFTEDEGILVSPDWKGVFFTEEIIN